MKTCIGCGATKPLDEFHLNHRARDGRVSRCKPCVSEYGRQFRTANGERLREQRRLYREANRESLREARRQYYAANRERVRAVNDRWNQQNRAHRLQKQAEWREANRERLRNEGLRYYEANRSRVLERLQGLRSTCLEYYGTVCACCGGEDHLEIDHVNGGGSEHRKQVGTGARFFLWLISQRFPDGYQTLCRPCNRSKGPSQQCRLVHSPEESQ